MTALERAATSNETFIPSMGDWDNINSYVRRFLEDEAFRLRAMMSYGAALGNTMRNFMFMGDFEMIYEIEVIAQGCLSKSFVDLLPDEPRDISETSLLFCL